MPGSNPAQPLRILMLHGYTQSGTSFRAKTRALEKNLQKAFGPGGVALHYATAPIRLRKSDVPKWDEPTGGATAPSTDEDDDIDAFAWWRRKGDAEPFVYEGFDEGLASVAAVLRAEGPFDGAIGFSQGGALAGVLASLLEPGRRAAFSAAGGMAYPPEFITTINGEETIVHPPLRWAVSYSGFMANAGPEYAPLYEPPIATPMLHFLGTVDTVVEEARSLKLVDACVDGRRDGRLVYHPGGHFLPSSQRQYVGALVSFIRETMDGPADKHHDESVEDMDVPF